MHKILIRQSNERESYQGARYQHNNRMKHNPNNARDTGVTVELKRILMCEIRAQQSNEREF